MLIFYSSYFRNTNSVTDIPYLFELRHPVPRPNFEGVPLFKKSKNQYIIGATHEYNLDYEPMSPGH